MKGFCFKCRKSVEIKSPKQAKLANGRSAVNGVCPACSTKVFRMVKG